MSAPDVPDGRERPAGRLGVWLGEISAAVRDGAPSDVPCAGCTACCSAAQFVHVGPDEERALARIPVELLFAAPGLPPGNVLMGYDDQGRCPMLGEAGCTIYEDRPRACRVYDCRIFAATGVIPDEPGKQGVAARAATWRFGVTTEEEQLQWEALHLAAERLAAIPDAAALGSPARAVAALRVHPLFLGPEGIVQPASGELVEAMADADT